VSGTKDPYPLKKLFQDTSKFRTDSQLLYKKCGEGGHEILQSNLRAAFVLIIDVYFNTILIKGGGWPLSTKEFWLRESVQMAAPLISEGFELNLEE